MLSFADIRIRPKLMSLFLLTGVLPLILVGFLYSKWIDKSVIAESFNKLVSIQNIRKGQIENHFAKSLADIRILSVSDRIVQLLDSSNLDGNVVSASATDSEFETTQSGSIHEKLRAALMPYIDAHGYQDLYLIDGEQGRVLFSLGSGDDHGTSLQHGPYNGSGLAKAWRNVMSSNSSVIIDFEPYEPADYKEMAFLGHPVRNKLGRTIGVLALRFDADLISKIVESRKGMGETGESYLVGWLQATDTFELRSELKTMGEGRYVVGFDLGYKLEYWLDAAEAGDKGGADVYVDSSGSDVLVAYDKLKIEGLTWYLISKIDRYEVTEPLRVISRQALLVAAFLTLLIAVGAWLLSRSFTRPIIAEKEFAESIARGELGAELQFERRDELGDLAHSLNSMAKNLREVDWLKSGTEELDDELRGELSLDELSQRCIRFFVNHLGAALGAVYFNEQGVLALKASYAFSNRAGNFNQFSFGEGMVGQAALEGTILYFSMVADEAPALNYGAGERIPDYFAVVPLLVEGDIIGVMLLGSMASFSELQQEFISQNAGRSAILFGAAKSRHQIAELLAGAKVQQEELQVTNDELEAQAMALRESEAELQAQQEELRVTNEELTERTQALEKQKTEISSQNEKLHQTQKIVEKKVRELEITSRYKSEFLANMSHELRTPLNSILILSQIIAANKEANLTKKQVESAEAINSSGSELLTLINEILDLSKVEAGKIDLTIEDVSLEQITKDLERTYQGVSAEKGVALKFVRAENIPPAIKTDAQRLQQILRNLLTNAFKFTDKGEIVLEMARPSSLLVEGSPLEEQHTVAFAVKDQGIGIPEEKQSAIFEAFQQADGSTSRKFGGTGLGLSISKELTRLLGGFIHLFSVEGEGSTFTVVLPDAISGLPEEMPTSHFEQDVAHVAVDRSVGVGPKRQESVAVKASLPDIAIMSNEVEDDRKDITPAAKSLLIVEDDHQFAKVVLDFARERGFKCIVAEDGEKGLHFADYFQPSAIILDIGLPGIDGWTVMERLKKDPKLRHIPVHFMSAADNSMDAMRMGAIGYLTKPVTMEKIEASLAKIETIIANPMSRLLVVEDDDIQRQSIIELIGDSDVTTTAVATGAEAYRELELGGYDCMILDLGLSDMSGFELLEQIQRNDSLDRVPVIVYTGRDLSQEEEKQLGKYAESIIIKGAKSPERLLDESALFLHRVEADLPEEQRQMLKQVHNKEAVLSDRTILLVDDDMRNVFALSSVLEEVGIVVIVARDGVECLEKLKEHDDVEAILMDIMMPRMDGYDAMRAIRKEQKYKKLPIIALTAKAMKGDRSKCIEAGASDYLAKPVNPDKLISMLRVWLY